MTPDQLAQLHWMVLGATALASIFLGSLLQRTHFCTMGAVSDAVIMGSFHRLRQWALALVVATIGFGVMTFLKLISPLQSVYATGSVLWLSASLGGLLFGWGMVWASGCSSKLIVRAGAGNLKSGISLLVMAVVALMAIKGALAIPRVYALDAVKWEPTFGVFASQWLSVLAKVSIQEGSLLASILAVCALSAWIFKDKDFLTRHNITTGLSVGLVICVMWWISGVLGHGLEHPETLDEFFLDTSSRKMEAMSLTAPLAFGLDALMYLSDGTKRFTIGMVSVLGIFMGSLASAKLNGTFKVESFSNFSDLFRHVIGACFMGVGAVLAMGCTFGQGLSGLSTLSLMSLIATLSILIGAYLALQYDLRKDA